MNTRNHYMLSSAVAAITMMFAPLHQTAAAFSASAPNNFDRRSKIATPPKPSFPSPREPSSSLRMFLADESPLLTLTSPLLSYMSSSAQGTELQNVPAVLMDVAFSSVVPSGVLSERGDVSSPSFDSALTSSSFTLGAATTVPKITPQPVVTSELLGDAAHIALDLTALIGPATVMVRAAAVVGRILSIAADYLPDHSMLPEEFVFQMCMLVASLVSLYNAALPLAKASFGANMTHRDGRVYNELFKPYGVTWGQYKALSVTAFEWVTVQPGETITSEDGDDADDSIYWLYKGDVVVESLGKPLHMVAKKPPTSTSRTQQDHNADLLGLFGEMRFFHEIECGAEECYLPLSTVKAGPSSSATLLRIKAPKLKHMMNHDTRLEKSIRRIFFKGVQHKMRALLQQQA